MGVKLFMQQLRNLSQLIPTYPTGFPHWSGIKRVEHMCGFVKDFVENMFAFALDVVPVRS